MNNVQIPTFDPACDSCSYRRDGVLLWDAATAQAQAPYVARFATEDGVHSVISWIDPPFLGDPDVVDKVSAVILGLPNDQMYVVNAQRDSSIDPIAVIPTWFCPVPSAVEDLYGLLQTITTPDLCQFVRDVFTLKAVFRGFWMATAGSKHHAWHGGLAWHSLEVANDVAELMTSRAQGRVNFTAAEYELGVIAALLHDVGKTVSYTGQGYCTERALTIGHELLGVELIHKPLETLRANRTDLADAMTALLLSRTRFACSTYRLEAIREVISKADRESAKRDTKPR